MAITASSEKQCCSCGVIKPLRDDPRLLAEAIRYLAAPLPLDIYPLLRRNAEAPSVTEQSA